MYLTGGIIGNGEMDLDVRKIGYTALIITLQ